MHCYPQAPISTDPRVLDLARQFFYAHQQSLGILNSDASCLYSHSSLITPPGWVSKTEDTGDTHTQRGCGR